MATSPSAGTNEASRAVSVGNTIPFSEAADPKIVSVSSMGAAMHSSVPSQRELGNAEITERYPVAGPVVVVVPVYRIPLLAEEQISLRHLRHFLGNHPIVVVAPNSLAIDDPYLRSTRIMRFADDFFANIAGYNRLMLSRQFYSRFRQYDYVLIYQLDCLVFSDQLEKWCEQGWDYVGAPWFRGHASDTSEGLWAVGNGGLSLRRVAAFLDVLNSRKAGRVPPFDEPGRFHKISGVLDKAYRRCKSMAYSLGYKNTVGYVARNYRWHEDSFWSFEASHFVKQFRLPSPQQALGFAFEMAPRFCYAALGNKLPFGCHAWSKIDRGFWKQFLLPEADELDGSTRQPRVTSDG